MADEDRSTYAQRQALVNLELAREAARKNPEQLMENTENHEKCMQEARAAGCTEEQIALPAERDLVADKGLLSVEPVVEQSPVSGHDDHDQGR